MYDAKSVGIRFSGNPRVYTYGVPLSLRGKYITRGSRVLVFSPLTGPEVVTVCEVYPHRAVSVRSSIQKVISEGVPSFKTKKKKKEEEFDRLFVQRIGRLSYREKRGIVIDNRLFSSKELMNFSIVG